MAEINYQALMDKIRWNDRGLVPVLAQDAENGEVLMLAWMNAEALRLTLEEKRGVYFSRSRNEIWRKGDGSGHVQDLVSLHIDCDEDCLLMKVKQTGAACHTGSRSCFYREITSEGVVK